MGTGRSGRLRRAVRLGVPLALLAVTAAGCDTQQVLRLGWPNGVTQQAQRMLHLWQGSVVAALAVGFFVWGLIFWSVIRYRKRTDELPPQVHYNLPIEVLYTIVPFLIVAVLFYYTAIDESYVDKESPKPDVTVHVVAFQWNWKFSYDRRDKSGNIIETIGTNSQIPILVLPTNEKVRFIENSDDVIHSFWVPDFLFKRDVIPGRTNSFEVTIDRQGAFVGRCAEFCGTYHSAMNFEVRAVSPADYQRYLTARAGGLSTGQALQAIGLPATAVTTHPFNRTGGSAS